MIVTDLHFLKQPCVPVESIEEGTEIAEKIIEVIDAAAGEILGLSANQIGIQKQVCVISVKSEKLILMNPAIVNLDSPIPLRESCLSFPGEQITTMRYSKIEVVSLNNDVLLVGRDYDLDSRETYDDDIIEAGVIQHEVDYLNGVTMFDRKLNMQPTRRIQNYGRNDVVNITNLLTLEEKSIKFKKVQPYLSRGWTIVK